MNPLIHINKTQQLICNLIEITDGIDDKVKLAKLQYFVDFIHYAFNNKPVSNEDIVYDKQKFGPLSVTFNTDLKTLIEKGVISQPKKFHYQCNHIFTNEISEIEKKTINFVINKYGDLSYKELSEISHKQIPYLSAPMGGIIPLFTAYSLVDEYPDYEN
ncbi:MAG: Panacea domain-containing protein [bacterium]